MTQRNDLPYRKRRDRLAERLARANLDAYWIMGLPNIRYLSGFTGTYAQLLISRQGAVFITDGRYQEQVESEVSDCEVLIFRNRTWPEVFAEEIRERGWKRIGFEARQLTVEGQSKARDALSDPIHWEPISSWVEELRVVKDSTELETLARSGAVADRVFEQILGELREGITERQVLRRMMNLFWEHGAKGPSFDLIVLFGARSSLPHGQPGDTPLRKGDWVLLDFGGLVDGYCSDCTRTFVFGEPDSTQRDRHELVMEAHRAAGQAVRPGAVCNAVDQAARRVLEEAGFGEAFIHGLGHGVGLEIHEAPRLAPPSREILQEGMVVTIEPGIYLPGWGGIRIENAVVVTAAAPLPLTRSERGIQPFL